MHILTFDIEEWFHLLDHPETRDMKRWNGFPSRIESEVEILLDFCDRFRLRATFFILGWVAERAPDVVSKIAVRGHEIGCHSYSHGLVHAMSPDQFEHDLMLGLDRIESATGIRPRAYRAPGFSITWQSTWAFDILARNGIEFDSSVFPAHRAHGGLPAFPVGKPCILETASGRNLKCFPMSFCSVLGSRWVFSGGGYFRLAPYRLLKLGFQRSEYVMTYFHPRDFDPGQPMVPGLSLARRFKAYVGLDKTLFKLERLARDCEFVSLEAAATTVDWENVDRFLLGASGGAV